MTEQTAVKHIDHVLKNPRIMADPQRPVIVYDDLMNAIEETEEGWTIHGSDAPVLFVSKKTGIELLHVTLAELVNRYNGVPVHPHKNYGHKA